MNPRYLLVLTVYFVFLPLLARGESVDLVLNAVLSDSNAFLSELSKIVNCDTCDASRFSLTGISVSGGRTYATLVISSGTPSDTELATRVVTLTQQGHLDVLHVERATIVVAPKNTTWIWIGGGVVLVLCIVIAIVLYIRWRNRQAEKAVERKQIKAMEEKLLGPEGQKSFQEAAAKRRHETERARAAMQEVRHRVEVLQRRNKELLEVLNKARQLEREVEMISKGQVEGAVDSDGDAPLKRARSMLLGTKESQDEYLDFELHTDHEDSQFRWWHRGYDEARGNAAPNYQHTVSSEQVHQLLAADTQKEEAGYQRSSRGVFDSQQRDKQAQSKMQWWHEIRMPQLDFHVRSLLEIRPSPFHGGGLFARDFIPSGMLLFSYTQPCHFKNQSIYLNRFEMDMRYGIGWWINLHFYATHPDDDLFVVAEEPGVRGWGCLINSCRGTKLEPNCELIWPNNIPWVRTTRPILPSVELLMEYSY